MQLEGAGGGAGGAPRAGAGVAGDLFAGLYGAVVWQLLQDCGGEAAAVNRELRRMGESAGGRLVDEILARGGDTRVGDFPGAVEAVAGGGLRAFLGAAAAIGGWNPERTRCQVRIESLPMAQQVELPEEHAELEYLGFVSGLLQGCLAQLGMRVEVREEEASPPGKNPARYSATLELLEHAREEYPFKDD